MKKPKSISSSRGKPLVYNGNKDVVIEVHESDPGDSAVDIFNRMRKRIEELNAESALLNLTGRHCPNDTSERLR